VSYTVKADPGVTDDLRTLKAQQADVPLDWRLSDDEVELAIDMAVRLMNSLRSDPYQGEVLRGKERVLEGARRLKFDPLDPPPVDHRGAPRPRMRLVWKNEPDESAIGLVRVLAVCHRWDSRPYKAAASRLADARRRHGKEGSS